MLKQYVEEIQKYPLLTIEQEQELAKRIADGDEEAKTQLIHSNLRLVLKIAHEFKGMGVTLDDLVGAGNIGLIRAVSKYKPGFVSKRGNVVKFSSYAAYHIKHHIKDALSKMSGISSMSIGTRDRRKKILNKKKELGEDCTADDIAKAIGMKRSKHIQNVLNGGGNTKVSLDKCIDDEGRVKFMDLIKDESEKSAFEILDFDERVDLAIRKLSMLDEKSIFILKNRFGMNKEETIYTLEEISKMLGVTKERIRQLESEALRTLRNAIDENNK